VGKFCFGLWSGAGVRVVRVLLSHTKKKLLPPVNWRWVKEGDGYVRHEGLAPYPYRAAVSTVSLAGGVAGPVQVGGCEWEGAASCALLHGVAEGAEGVAEWQSGSGQVYGWQG
jgi:hypothetical protein